MTYISIIIPRWLITLIFQLDIHELNVEIPKFLVFTNLSV